MSGNKLDKVVEVYEWEMKLETSVALVQVRC